MNILIAPHNDDEALFASYVIQRTHPIIFVCMDGNQHERKGLCTIAERQKESEQAAQILGADVEFLGISDDIPLDEMRQELRQAFWKVEEMIDIDVLGIRIFVPKKDGGNAQHDLVSDVATDIFDECLYYGTYSKDRLFPAGEMEIIPTPEEITLKEQALACYTSQLRINPHHFEAVKGKSEYLSFAQ